MNLGAIFSNFVLIEQKNYSNYSVPVTLTETGTWLENDWSMINNFPVKYHTCPGDGLVSMRETGTEELLNFCSI